MVQGMDGCQCSRASINLILEMNPLKVAAFALTFAGLKKPGVSSPSEAINLLNDDVVSRMPIFL